KDGRAELACCTKLTQQHPGAGAPVTSSVHLTHFSVDPTGRVLVTTAPGGTTLDVTGPSTWETGFLLPPPAEAIHAGLKWEVAETGRLPRRCTVNLPDPGVPEETW